MKKIEIPHPYESWTEFFNNKPNLLESHPAGPFSKVVIQQQFSPTGPESIFLFDLLVMAAKENHKEHFETKELDCLYKAMEILHELNKSAYPTHRDVRVDPLLERIYRLLKDRHARGL